MAANEAGAGSGEIALTEDDVLAAMKRIPGYLDITPRDFRELYVIAYEEALARIFRERRAADIMTRRVITVTEETLLSDVAAAMGAAGISGVPVVDGEGRVTGVITERDFLNRLGVPPEGNFMTLVANCLATKKCLALPIKNYRAKDIMTSPPVVIPPEMTIQEISELLQTKQINRTPVIDADGRVVGIVSRDDLVRAMFRGAKRC